MGQIGAFRGASDFFNGLLALNATELGVKSFRLPLLVRTRSRSRSPTVTREERGTGTRTGAPYGETLKQPLIPFPRAA